jgi:hypothetical protein
MTYHSISNLFERQHPPFSHQLGAVRYDRVGLEAGDGDDRVALCNTTARERARNGWRLDHGGAARKG